MIGHHQYHRKTVLVDMDALVPEHHLLRKLSALLDLSFIREICEPLYCENRGRPSIDPEIFFRICLLIYLYNIPSDRQVCEELGYNLAYRWFCKIALDDPTPEHSSITRIRDRLGEKTFKEIFDRLIKDCLDLGLIKASNVMMDGSIVKADAALGSMVPRPKPGQDLGDEVRSKYVVGKKFANETHVSRTDPDASLCGKVGESKKLGYKVHDTIECESCVVIDAYVTGGSEMEGKVMSGRIDHIESTFGVRIEELTADRGYGYGVNLDDLQKRVIRSYVPNFHEEVGDNIDLSLFPYDAKVDSFTCKAGHTLKRITSDEAEAKNYARRYQIEAGHCPSCPFHKLCFGNDRVTKYQRKFLQRNIFWQIQAETKEREKTDNFRIARGERQCKMEGIFAEAKDNHGLARARYRGRAKMQIQAYMISIVQNLKRILGIILARVDGLNFGAKYRNNKAEPSNPNIDVAVGMAA